MSYPSKTILGIDPGTARMGFGVITTTSNTLKLIAYGCVTTTKETPHHERLMHIYREVSALITTHRPDEVAVEQLFFYNNAKTAFSVGEARGVIVLAAAQQNIPLREITPLQVKQAVSAYGKASKVQVQRMVKLLLSMRETPQPDDAADALAVAITCANTPYYEKK